MARHIFIQLLSAIRYVILYGRRSIQIDQVNHILRTDVDRLTNTFDKLIHDKEMNECKREINQLFEVMNIPTDELIAMYNQQRAPLPFPIMARIIAARSGKNAGKFIDKLRGK